MTTNSKRPKWLLIVSLLAVFAVLAAACGDDDDDAAPPATTAAPEPAPEPDPEPEPAPDRNLSGWRGFGDSRWPLTWGFVSPGSVSAGICRGDI